MEAPHAAGDCTSDGNAEAPDRGTGRTSIGGLAPRLQAGEPRCQPGVGTGVSGDDGSREMGPETSPSKGARLMSHPVRWSQRVPRIGGCSTLHLRAVRAVGRGPGRTAEGLITTRSPHHPAVELGCSEGIGSISGTGIPEERGGAIVNVRSETRS